MNRSTQTAKKESIASFAARGRLFAGENTRDRNNQSVHSVAGVEIIAGGRLRVKEESTEQLNQPAGEYDERKHRAMLREHLGVNCAIIDLDCLSPLARAEISKSRGGLDAEDAQLEDATHYL